MAFYTSVLLLVAKQTLISRVKIQNRSDQRRDPASVRRAECGAWILA